MRTVHLALAAVVCLLPAHGFGQSPTAAAAPAQAGSGQSGSVQSGSVQSGSAQAAKPPATATALAAGAQPAPSAVLADALRTVQQTVNAVNLQKWKRGTVREEAGDHLNAIQKDLQTTLPPLLQEADAAPGTLSKVLPVSRNISALYDVLLSVVEGARVAGPGEQVGALEQALSSLGAAQRALEDQVQQTAVLGEKQVAELRVAVAKASQVVEKTPAKPVAAAAPCAATPARKPRRKPAAKPANPAKPASQAKPAAAKPVPAKPAQGNSAAPQ